MIEILGVSKAFGSRQILDQMTLTVPEGMNFVLMGPSGSGKSVTLKHVIGILRPDAGSVQVDGQEVPAMDHTQLMALRRRMGYLFQNGALINWLSVEDNVALHRARIGAQDADHVLQRDALAAARRAHQHEVHALGHGQRHAVEDLPAAEPLLDVAQFDHPVRK